MLAIRNNRKLIFKCIKSRNSFFVIHFLKNFNVNAVHDENGDGILLHIIKHGTIEMFKFYLTKYGMNDFDRCDCQGVHYLFFVIERRDLDLDTIRSCLMNCNTNVRSNMYGSLLYHAIFNRQISIVRLLLTLGADVNSCDNRGNPVIFYCVLHGLIEVSGILVNTDDFDVNKRNNAGQSIFELSIVKNMFIHSKLFLKKFPDDLRSVKRTLACMELCIERGNTVLAWKLYQNYAACKIQRGFRNFISRKKLLL